MKVGGILCVSPKYPECGVVFGITGGILFLEGKW